MCGTDLWRSPLILDGAQQYVCLDALATPDFNLSESQSISKSTFDDSMSYMFKAYVSAVNLGYLKPFLVHLTRRQNFDCKLRIHFYSKRKFCQ